MKMPMMPWMRSIANELAHLFFPRHCLLCGRSLAKGEEQICLPCLCQLPRTEQHLQADNPLVEALREAFPFERGMAFYYFERGGKMRQLVHAIKYKGYKKAGYWIARHVARELMAIQSDFTQFDYLVPVPLHRDKQRERGFNQSEWIARGLQSVWGTPIDTTSLVRAQATESQTHKTPLERWQNVCAVFKASEDSPLAGKRVLLVDDVCTTGSTFLACAHALNALPDTRVSFLALAGA